MAKVKSSKNIVCQNRRARYDYEIEETIEVGLMLVGTEVKSLRQGRASIAEAYAGEKDGELYLINSFIPEYTHGTHYNHRPKRARKLLVRKREMERLIGAVSRKGVTLVPMSIYFNARGVAKMQLGLAHGKRKVEKREAEKERDWQRQKERIMRDKG